MIRADDPRTWPPDLVQLQVEAVAAALWGPVGRPGDPLPPVIAEYQRRLAELKRIGSSAPVSGRMQR